MCLKFLSWLLIKTLSFLKILTPPSKKKKEKMNQKIHFAQCKHQNIVLVLLRKAFLQIIVKKKIPHLLTLNFFVEKNVKVS